MPANYRLKLISFKKKLKNQPQYYLEKLVFIFLAITSISNLAAHYQLSYSNRIIEIKGGESSSQFRWFTIAKIEL